jgi:riboflavin kinase/FMN adenylyltransferase
MPAYQGGVVTIGNFDGVHIGHQALIKQVVQEAKKRQLPSLVITFEPHPFEFFAKGRSTIPRLTRWREKWNILSDYDIDYMVILKFTQALANKTANDFVRDILIQALQLNHLVVGDDFQFGYQRQGNIQLLQKMSATWNFTVEAMPTTKWEGERVSSTRIRQALIYANHTIANHLLGRPYSMIGKVSHGDKLGRKLGFPTLNILLHRQLAPLQGIYVVYVKGIADFPWPGVASIGSRPTINDGKRSLLEVHLFDFNQEIYGQTVEVIFCEKLRDEVAYPTLELLKEQIAKDVEIGKRYFKNMSC